VSAVIACVSLLTAQAAFAATPWTEHDFGSPAEERIESAQVLTSSDGTQNVAWKRYSCCNETPMFERRRANGEVVLGPTVLSNSGRQTYWVSEATTPDDTTYFVWDETGIGVKADIITPGGEIRSLPILTSGPTSATEVSVSLNAENNAVVVWGYPTLEYAVINPAGEVVKQHVIAEENGHERNVATTTVPNGVFAAWTERTESGSVVKATRISEATNEPGSVFNLNTNVSDSVYALHVAANATGDVIASWAAENYGEQWEANVRSTLVSAGANVATQEVPVELPGAYYVEFNAPYIYPSGAGGVAAIANHETGPSELILTPIAATGVPASTYVVPTTGGAEGPSVVANTAGHAYLAWVEETGGTPRAVTAELTEHSTPANTETLITPVPPNRTSATINASGELILATWNYSENILRSYIRSTLGACSAGTYSATGNEPCTVAQPGSYVAMSGATTQIPCPPGTYSSDPGASSCTATPAGTYATGGATEPTPCQVGATSVAGSSTCTPISTSTPLSMSAPTQTGTSTEPEAAPVITSVFINHRCVTPATLHTNARASGALHFSYTLSEAAKVEYTVSHHVGSPAWTRCPAAQGHKPGTYETIYTGSNPSVSGSNSAAVKASVHAAPSGPEVLTHSLTLAAVIADAHIGAHTLRPGTYVISMVAVNAHGARSQRATVKFWVVAGSAKPHAHTGAR